MFSDEHIADARVRDPDFAQALRLLKALPLNTKTRAECIAIFLMTLSDANLLVLPGTDSVLKYGVIRY